MLRRHHPPARLGHHLPVALPHVFMAHMSDSLDPLDSIAIGP